LRASSTTKRENFVPSEKEEVLDVSRSCDVRKRLGVVG
jgi:hypothetical protein